jgi:ABC-type lipoprotein release transport system permease subunit
MQKSDVKMIFILETSLLAFFSAIAGTIVAFIVMGLSSLIPFNVVDNPFGMLLVKQHLYFLPSFFSIVSFFIVIIILAGCTAYFPANRASKISAAEALRHYE